MKQASRSQTLLRQGRAGLLTVFVATPLLLRAEDSVSSNAPGFSPGEVWRDTAGQVINAHDEPRFQSHPG